MNYIHIS